MALALYRTYRPGSLGEVIGQEHVTEPLRRALESGRTHHAYLFSGPRGCGKTSTARILARSLNCAEGPTADPCGRCDSCQQLAPNGPGSMDVVELDAATHRGIDDARDLREKAIYAPAASRYKIYIVDEAHQLTNEAANALLKLVEEPPPHLRFVFATTEPDKIIPTIRSRTFHYGFRLVSARTLADHLSSVCRREEVPAEPAAIAVVARAGAGSVRDSLSVLGQLLAGTGPDGLTYADATSALGLTDSALLDDFVAALAEGSAAEMFGVVDRVIGAGHDPRRFVTDVLDRLRDLLVLRVDPQALVKGLVDVPDDAGQRMAEQAQTLGMAQLSHAADTVSVGLGQIKGATAPRLQLELLCARLALPEPGEATGSILARLDRLERSGSAVASESGTRPRVPQDERADHDHAASEPSVSQGLGREPQAAQGVGPGPAANATEAPSATGPTRTARATPGPAAGSGERTNPPRRPKLRSERAGATQGPAQSRGGPGAAAAKEATGSTGGTGPAAGSGSAEAAGSPRATESPPVSETSGGTGSAGASHPSGPAPVEASGQVSLAAVQQAWPVVLDRLAVSSRVAWTAFHAATPVSCSAGALAVAVAEPGNVRAIAQRGHDERLRQALIDVLGVDLTIDVMHAPSATSPAGPPTTPATDPPAQRPTSPGSAARRPGDVVRAAGASGPGQEIIDEPSPDDPDLEAGAADGLALITRELGARPIGEIDHA